MLSGTVSLYLLILLISYKLINSKFVSHQVKSAAEAKAGAKFSQFQAKSYKTQVVAGTNFFIKVIPSIIIIIIIHQTHYEKSDWSRAFNQFTIACELDMIHYIAFIMSSSTSAWLLSPLECSPQKQNG